MEVNYGKLIFINYCIVGMNCILYVVWGIVSKKNLFWCKVEMLNCYCSSDINIFDLNYDFVVIK